MKPFLWLYMIVLLVVVFLLPKDYFAAQSASKTLDSAFVKTALPKTVRRGSSYNASAVVKNTDIEAWGENVFLLFFQPGSPPVGVPFIVRSLPDWPAIEGRVFRNQPPQFGALVARDEQAEFAFSITIPPDMKRGEYRFAVQLVQVVSEGHLWFKRFGEKFPVTFSVK